MTIMETRENLSLPKNEEHDTKKYTKHINDLIEDAEIEASISASSMRSLMCFVYFLVSCSSFLGRDKFSLVSIMVIFPLIISIENSLF